jgi:hypothetical protein
MTKERRNHPADLIQLFHRLVQLSADGEEDVVPVPTILAVQIVDLLATIKRPRGRPAKSGRVQVREASAYGWGRLERQKLIRKGCEPEAANARIARLMRKKYPSIAGELENATIIDRVTRKRHKRRQKTGS